MYLTPRDLYSIIDHHNVEPFLTFTAAAGPDYGRVQVWEILDEYLIKYGNNAETKYDFVSNIDDPAEWLEKHDLSPIGSIVQTANIQGAKYVEEANNHDIGPFFVMTTKYLKDGCTISQIEMDDHGAKIGRAHV